MNLSDILIGLGVALILFAAARTAWKRRGQCSCGNCGGCQGCSKKK